MARPRTKTRVEHLADALAAAQEMQVSLDNIDLRTTRGELRDSVKAARSAAEQSVHALAQALRADVPVH